MNIFEIEQDLLSIFDEIEENEGELTPELEEKLAITQENFKNKVKSYINLIKIKEGELITISSEIDRLKKFGESKAKLITKLQNIIIQSINKFGDTTPKGGKFFDYGTGKVNIRKTQIVGTNDELIKFIGSDLLHELNVRKETNQLNVLPPITKEELLAKLNTDETPFGITSDDLDNIKFDISVEVNLNDILTDNNFEFIKQAIYLSPKFKLSSKVSKTELKSKLKENGSCAPNIAALDYSESLTIK
ncbi:MAG: hypothetical protein GX638_18870 [Crenarchaeota archaeon]|nr:hypothetical protein [Thermoproteota archaeon]